MRIAIGLPNAIPEVGGRQLVEWARRAEAAGFSSLGTIGRIIWDGHEELVALAAAAGATSRIRLATTVLIGPARESVLLAKQAATLDSISGGRFTLGLGVGWREDDFTATGHDFSGRGRALEKQIRLLREVWQGKPVAAGGPVGPRPSAQDGPEILLGGGVPSALRRAGRLADAFMAAPSPPDAVRQQYAVVEEAARDVARDAPRLLVAGYFALGEEAERGRKNMADYYDAGGEGFVQAMTAGLLTTPEAIRHVATGLEGVGVDELFLWPAVDDLTQVDRLREALPN